MNKLAEIIAFDYRCNDGFLAVREGTAQDYIFVEGKDIKSPYFNGIFAVAELTESVISETKNRFEVLDRLPSFVVMRGSENEKICEDRDMGIYRESNLFQLDTRDFRDTSHGRTGLKIQQSSIPYKPDFIELMDEAFFVGGDDAEGWHNAFVEMTPNSDLDERVFTLYCEDKIASIAQTNNDFSQSQSFLYNVATPKNMRRKGYSAYLLSIVINNAIESGCRELYLTTSNPGAVALYEKLGFTFAGTKIFYVEN